MDKEKDVKINKYIDINEIAKKIRKNDFKNLRQIDKFGYDAPDYFLPAIEKIEKQDTLEDIVNQLGELFDKLAKDQKFDLALVVQNFLQRYTYFLASKNDYDVHANNINASVLTGHTVAEVFSAVYIPFFGQQLDFYAADFIDKLNQFDVRKWNEDYYNELLHGIEGIINEKDFVKKLEVVEQFVMKNSDPNDLYKKVGIDFEKPDPEKEAFATAFNEFKIILQSTDNLVESVIMELKEVMKEK